MYFTSYIHALASAYSNPVDPATFNQRQFLKKHTDIIAIERFVIIY